jgi:hypothetical protein
MTQQVDTPTKEVHWFNKIRCLEVTRRTEHYYDGEIIPTNVISLEYSRTVIDDTILMRRKKSRL